MHHQCAYNHNHEWTLLRARISPTSLSHVSHFVRSSHVSANDSYHSLSVVNIETPALKFPRAAYTTSSPVSGIDYTKPTPDLAPGITSVESDGTIWAGPRSVETYSSAFTSSGALIVEIGWWPPHCLGKLFTHLSIGNVVEVTDVSNLERTTGTEGKILESSLPQSFGITSSKEMPRSISPVQVAQTEDNTLKFDGVGLIETLVNSEISSNILTLTAFKTILVTTVLTSMICTCDTPLSPCKLTFPVYF